MMKRINLLQTLFLLFCLTLNSCDDHEDTADDIPDDTTSVAGLGESKERPEGTPLSLPENIRLVTAITGYKYKNATTDDCAPENALKIKAGSGLGYVMICLAFENTSSNPITVTLPPGLIIIAEERSYQNGLLIQLVEFQVPAHEIVYVSLAMYCANENRSYTKGKEDKYVLGPVLNNIEGINDLIDLVKDSKRLTYGPGTISTADYKFQSAIQDVIWQMFSTMLRDPQDPAKAIKNEYFGKLSPAQKQRLQQLM